MYKRRNPGFAAKRAGFRKRSVLPPAVRLCSARALHGSDPPDKPYDCLAISNPILERVFLPIDPETSFISSFRGLSGYDAGYYGYPWADAMAADMATVFEKAKDGYLDKQAGMKLRRESYEPGGSRDVAVSIEKFLGRKRSVEPFLKKVGVTSPRQILNTLGK